VSILSAALQFKSLVMIHIQDLDL